MFVCVLHVCGCHEDPLGPLKLELQAGIELSHVGAGNQTQVFCKSGRHSSLLRRLSRSHFVFLKGHCELDMVVHALNPNTEEAELPEFEANLVKSTK